MAPTGAGATADEPMATTVADVVRPTLEPPSAAAALGVTDPVTGTEADAPAPDREPNAFRAVALDWRAVERALVDGAADEPAFLDSETGELTYGTPPEPGGAGRLALEPLPEPVELAWMREFVAGLDDDWPRDALRDALLGAGAARAAFEQALGRFPVERMRWLACRRERMRACVSEWFASHGFAVRG